MTAAELDTATRRPAYHFLGTVRRNLAGRRSALEVLASGEPGVNRPFGPARRDGAMNTDVACLSL